TVPPEVSVPPDASVPGAMVDPDRIVESGPAIDPDVNGAPETAVDAGVDPRAFVEIMVGAESEIVLLAPFETGRVGAPGGSAGRFSSRLSSVRAPACDESSAIASTANRRAASRDPL